MGAVDDEFPEELGKGGEHMEHQAPAGSGGVEGFVHGPEPEAAAPQIGNDHDQVLQGAAEPVQGGDYEGVAGAAKPDASASDTAVGRVIHTTNAGFAAFRPCSTPRGK